MSYITNIILITDDREDERVGEINEWLQKQSDRYDSGDILLKEISEHAAGARCLEIGVWATAINGCIYLDDFAKFAESVFTRECAHYSGWGARLIIKTQDEEFRQWDW